MASTGTQLVAELERHGQALSAPCAGATPPPPTSPPGCSGPRSPISLPHLGDLYEALALPHETETLVARYGFASFRAWLGERIAASGLAPLRLADPADTASAWVLGGEGEPGASLEAERYQLFRAISGRRRLEDVRSWSWRGDPSAYLPVISPYPQS